MADKKIKVGIDIDVNAEPSIAQLKALKKELKSAAAGSEEFNKIYNQIDDLEDKIKSAKNTSADWVDSLESAGGPLGALGGALNKLKVSTQSFGAALKATGIGLVVAAIGGLVGAFSQTDGAMKKLEPLMIAMQKILGGILEAMMPLIDAFIDLAVKALPYVTTGVKVFYSSLVALFTLVKEGGGGIGKILKGIFTLDTDTIKAGYSQLTGTWAKTVDAFEASEKRFDEGYAKKTRTEKENYKNSKELADKALADKIKRMEVEDKLDEARLNKLKAEAMETAFSELQKLSVEETFAKKSYDLKKKELEDKQLLYKKDSVEYNALEAEKIQLDADRLTQLKSFNEQRTKIQYDALKAEVDFEIKLAQDLQKIDDDNAAKKLQAMNDDLLLLQAQQKVLTEGSQAYLDNSIAIENEAYQIKLTNAKKNATQIKAIELEHAQNLKDIHLKAFIAEKEIQLGRLAVAASIGNSLSQLAGKNKALAIAGLVIAKAAAIGEIWVNNSIANAKAIAVSPLTFGQPWVTINTISAIVGTAAAIASGVQAINEINSVNTGGSSGGAVASSGGSSGAVPSLPTAQSVEAPQIQTTGGQDATSKIGETIGGVQKPIQAYVVSQEVSSMQALDRRTNRAATLSGG
jgi:hypothetical protein